MTEQFLVHVAIIWQQVKCSITLVIVPLNNKLVKLNLGGGETEMRGIHVGRVLLASFSSFCTAVDKQLGKVGSSFYYMCTYITFKVGIYSYMQSHSQATLE